MKRSSIARTSGLARAEKPLSRSEALGRGNGRLSRSKPQKAILSPETALAVYTRQHGRCACGCGGTIAPFPIGYHHIFPKAKWPELADVPENVVGLTANCHANHETFARRLHREVIHTAEPLAATEKMRSYLERTYA